MQEYFRDPCPDLHEQSALLGPGSSSEALAIQKLFSIEALLYEEKDINYQKIDEFFKLVAGLGAKKTADTATTLIRLKYLDLLTDYQLAFAKDACDLKVIELLSKKINILAGQDNGELLVRDLQFKVLVLYLLSGSDFRKKNVYQYLSEENVFSRDHAPAMEKFIALHQQDVIIPLDVYVLLVDHLNALSRQFRALYNKHSGQFLENFLEMNLEKLPRYYRSIKFASILNLFQCDLVDYEDLVYRMINSKKFPAATKIDQVRDMVDFGEEPRKYDAFNTRVKKICDVVGSLASTY